jgi:hypothetical protein
MGVIMSKNKQSWSEWIQSLSITSLFYGNEVVSDTANKITELAKLADANGLEAPIKHTDPLQSAALLSQALQQGLDHGISGLEASRLDIANLAASFITPSSVDTTPDDLSQSTLSAIEKVNNALKNPRLKDKIIKELNKDTPVAIDKPTDIDKNIQKEFNKLLPKDQKNVLEILTSDYQRNLSGNTAKLNGNAPDNDNIEEIIQKDFNTLSLTYQKKIIDTLNDDHQRNVNKSKPEKLINPEEIKLANFKATLLSDLGKKLEERKPKQTLNEKTIQSIIETPKISEEKTDGVDKGLDKGAAKANLENLFAARFPKKIPEASSFAEGISKKSRPSDKPKEVSTLQSAEKLGYLSIN